ncbi:MAG: Clp protease N-terminal domain-containing protein [Terriglobales bacterium]
MKTQPGFNKALPLSIDCKRVIAYTADEANQLKDYWIDTEHLVLGILREEDCAAAKRLREIGLQIEPSRQLVADNIGSRPFRLPVLWWSRAFWNRPVDSIATIVLVGGLLFGFIILAYVLR